MKYFICIFILIACMIVPGAAQKKGQSGQDYFKKQEYAIAINAFEKELKKAKNKKAEQARIEAYIGMSYYYMNQPVDASKRLKNGIQLGYKKADAYAVYGLSLQKQEQYTEALEAFEQCLKLDGNHPNIDLYIQSCKYAMDHPEPNSQITLRSSKINTAGSEYGVSPLADGKIFFSLAPVKGRIDPRTGMAYTEVYSTKVDGNDFVNPQKEKVFNKMYYNTGFIDRKSTRLNSSHT